MRGTRVGLAHVLGTVATLLTKFAVSIGLAVVVWGIFELGRWLSAGDLLSHKLPRGFMPALEYATVITIAASGVVSALQLAATLLSRRTPAREARQSKATSQ